jgi:hypothetical protein
MLGGLAAREFRLTREGVACSEAGLAIGGVALLARAAATPQASWSVRPLADLDAELTARYGLAVDVSDKAEGIAVVARALDKGDIALAQIAALLLQFPDPPEFAKQALEGSALVSLASELICSGLLKGDWNSDAHPRTGTPPNRGWFAPVPKDSEPSKTPRAGWPSRPVNIAIRTVALELAIQLVELEPHVRTAVFAFAVIVEVIDWLRDEFPDENFDPSQQRVADQLYTNLQPAKTLEELQTLPQDHFLGYEQHHIVEQNSDNVAKDSVSLAELLLKFGQEALDDPTNLAWVPRLKHEQITAEYNSKYLDNPVYPLTREVVTAMDFNAQREAGLDALRRAGVLK